MLGDPGRRRVEAGPLRLQAPDEAVEPAHCRDRPSRSPPPGEIVTATTCWTSALSHPADAFGARVSDGHRRRGRRFRRRGRAPCLDLPQGADAGLGVDLVLRQHHRRRADPLDDRAHERADARARSAAPAARRASRAPPAPPGRPRTKRCSSLGAIASWRSSPWPTMAPAKACSQAGDRARIGTKPPSAVQALLIWRARRARTCSVISSVLWVTPRASAIASRIRGRSRIEMRSASRPCSTRWMPAVVIRAGTSSPISFWYSGGSSPRSFWVSA